MFRKRVSRRRNLEPTWDTPYYCDAFDHLDPRKLRQMAYGCAACKEPKPLEALPDETKNAIKRDVRVRDWAVWPFCPERPEHAAYRVVPHCPICGEGLDPLGFYPPVGFWGAPNSGKTVVSAVIASELRAQLLTLTGLSHTEMYYGVGNYWDDVVLPLLSEGKLPRRTAPDEVRKMVIKTGDQDWSQRKLTLTDMSGEVFHVAGEPGNTRDDNLAMRQRQLLLSKEVVFLANPEGSQGLGAVVDSPRIGLFENLLNCPGVKLALDPRASADDLDSDPYVTLCLAKIRDAVRDHGLGSALLPSRIAGILGSQTLQVEVAACIAKEKSRPAPLSFQQQLNEIITYLRKNGAGDGMRFAVAVSKADEIPGLVGKLQQDYERILAVHKLTMPRQDAQAQTRLRVDWAKALDEISALTQQVLAAHGEQPFVQLVRKNFAQSAFFFTSALGRRTELTARRVRTRSSPGTAVGGVVNVSSAGVTSAQHWEVGQRVSLDPASGTRRPDPHWVLLPLLWLLAGDS